MDAMDTMNAQTGMTGTSGRPAGEGSRGWDIVISHLKAGYGEHVVLQDVSGTLPAGAVSVILGGSGCGKSTLLKQIIGLAHPMAGSLMVGGTDLTRTPAGAHRKLRRNMGVLFQDGALLGALTLAQNVVLPLSEHLSLKKDQLRREALRVLSMVGLEEFADYYPNELSGGMRKRAGLARAIVAEPRILLCDEPTSGLDPITASRMDELLLGMHERFPDMTIVVVSHDLESMRAIADRVLVLRDGFSVFDGTVDELERTKDPYLRRFLARQPDRAFDAGREAMDPAVRAKLDAWLG